MDTVPRLDRRDLGLAGAVTLLAAGLIGGWRSYIGVDGALGLDATAWGLAAEGLWQGRSSPLPPAWPLATALLRAVGLDLVTAGSAVSALAAVLLPGAALLSARAAGAPRAGAVSAALVLLVLPDWMAWATSMDSNSFVALGLTVAVGLWASALQRPSPLQATTAAGLAIVTGLLPLLRESTLPAVAGALLLCAHWRARGLALALCLVATWWLSPLLLGELPGPSPMQTPWQDRGSTALADLRAGSGPLPNYVGEIPRAERGAYIASLREGDLLALAIFHARRSLTLAHDGWLLALALGAFALASLRRRPALRAVLLPLLCLAPALLIWTQRRHVLLVVPAMLTLLAGAAAWRSQSRSSRLGGMLVLALVLAATSTWPARWRALAAEQRGEGRRATTLAELGAWICAEDPLLLGGPIQDVALYCPRPRHEPDGSIADWHTLLIVPRQMSVGFQARGWQEVGPKAADLVVLRLHPQQDRPCPDGRVDPSTPYLQTRPTPARLLGCEASVEGAPRSDR